MRVTPGGWLRVLLPRREGQGIRPWYPVKKLFELVVCLIHPLAVILMWIDLATRPDMGSGAKLAWAILGLIPVVPFLYVLTGGDLW